MKRIAIFAIAMFSAGAAYAQATAVPEIDGPASFAALSAVGAFAVFLWERRRHR
jgi:hypothetical protein